MSEEIILCKYCRREFKATQGHHCPETRNGDVFQDGEYRQENPVMKEWIKELGENIGDYPKGTLSGRDPVVIYQPDKREKVHLEGNYSADQLEALAQHMRKHSTDPNQQSIPVQDQ